MFRNNVNKCFGQLYFENRCKTNGSSNHFSGITVKPKVQTTFSGSIHSEHNVAKTIDVTTLSAIMLLKFWFYNIYKNNVAKTHCFTTALKIMLQKTKVLQHFHK